MTSDNRLENNKENIRQQIMLKNQTNPYYVNYSYYSVNTDYDIFPYTRWFKGKALDDNPRIAEREAGFAFRNSYKTKNVVVEDEEMKPRVCIQNACSTVYPCKGNADSYLASNSSNINTYR